MRLHHQNVERQKQVSFTNSHFVTASRYVTKKSSKITKIDDLKGKTVVSTSGSTNIKQLNEVNTQRNLGINVLPANGHAEAFLMVETDRAVAFVMDDIIIAGLIANAKTPEAYWNYPLAHFRCPSPTGSCCAATTPTSNVWSMRPPRSSTRARDRQALYQVVPKPDSAEES